MTIIVEVFNFVIKNVFFSFITCVLMGGVSFLLSSVMLKNPILNYIVNVLRRRKWLEFLECVHLLLSEWNNQISYFR